ncbi:MAG: hypothetical protein ACI4QG_07255, partial [Candidatus Cryptobacteroides sp.]
SISKWMNAEGKVVLLDDIDMSSVTSWTPIGNASMTWASNVLKITGNAFEGWFDGQGHSLKNFAMLCDNATAGKPWGLFGVLGAGAVVENLVFDSTCSLSVKATAQTDCGILAGLMNDATVRNITNNAPLSFDGAAPDNNRMTMAVIGFANAVRGAVIENVVNEGNITAKSGGNTKNGGTAVQVAGICGFSTNDQASVKTVMVKNCLNRGNIESATGRASGIVASCNRYTVLSGCTNYGNNFNNFATTGGARIGNITCITGTGSALEDCTNYGDVICDKDGACGGIVCLVNDNGNKFTRVKQYGKVISDKYTGSTPLSYVGVFFGQCSKSAAFTDCICHGDLGKYNGGSYQMVGVTAENYFSYVGQIGSTAKNCTSDNIRWE